MYIPYANYHNYTTGMLMEEDEKGSTFICFYPSRHVDMVATITLS